MRVPRRTSESTDAIQSGPLVKVPYLKRAPEMALRRRSLPADRFTIISNVWVRDETLSWAARGLLAWMMSHAAGYAYNEATIVDSGPLGRDGVRVIIRELESAGYLHREREYLPGGGSTVDYVLSDPFDCAEADGESVVRSDQGEQAVSAGQPADGESAAPSFLEEQEKTKIPSGSTRATRSSIGTRIPEDFEPTEKMRAWFAAEQLGQVIDGRTEHAKFVDYWLGVPGAKGRKLDWAATWRVWMRSAADRAPRDYRTTGRALAIPTSGAPYKPSTTDQRVGQALDIARKYEEQGL